MVSWATCSGSSVRTWGARVGVWSVGEGGARCGGGQGKAEGEYGSQCMWWRCVCVGRGEGGRSAVADRLPTLMSVLSFFLKQEKRILRWPGFWPSTMLGMERSRSARENRMSSCMEKTEARCSGGGGEYEGTHYLVNHVNTFE